jgi:hypothetical protein
MDDRNKKQPENVIEIIVSEMQIHGEKKKRGSSARDLSSRH